MTYGGRLLIVLPISHSGLSEVHMSKRSTLVLSIVCLLLATLIVSPAKAQTTTYDRWGAHLWGWQGAFPYVGDQQYIDFWAFRDTTYVPGQPPSVHSMMRLHLLGPGGATNGVLIAEDWIDVVGDPDLMTVSDDLGWAGIDNTVSLLDRNSGTMVRVEFHVYWWAIEPVFDKNNVTKARMARVEGTIRVYGPKGFTVTLPGYYPSTSDVHIFRHPL
jgi:hypothetical protein